MAEAIATEGRVPYGEESRKYRRTVYQSQDDWIVHRSSFSIVENLKGGLFSGIIRRLKNDVLLVTAVATFVVLWNGLVDHAIMPVLALPSQPFTLSSPTLGLLLVFRTNASYARWLEARTRWGTIQTHVLNIARMACTFSRNEPEASAHLDFLLRVCWLVPRSLVNRFNGPEDGRVFVQEIESLFSGANVDEQLLKDTIVSTETLKRPWAAWMELSLALDALPIDEKRRLEIDKSIILLGECMTSCERIYTSPVPLVYTRHTGRFLSLWMLLLPLPLYDLFVTPESTGWLYWASSLVLLPVIVSLSIFLFGVQELSIQLEEPFSILPLDNLCQQIRNTTVAMQQRGLART